MIWVLIQVQMIAAAEAEGIEAAETRVIAAAEVGGTEAAETKVIAAAEAEATAAAQQIEAQVIHFSGYYLK